MTEISSGPAIRLESLSKQYRIGQAAAKYKTIRDALSKSASDLGIRLGIGQGHGNENGDGEDLLWALKDLSFEVQQGEVVGVIGRNGAGKSTLLKILSRITEPTSGHAEIQGRVSSLLEVGTGFHPELTGRENVYLNGAIIGMRRAEVDRKFDEIVAFAEIERFIDTPVKHYSSGMYVRLAFSVAAHLETDILLVDEVLSVGDAKFQAKCLGRMQDGTFADKTILFVSHNLPAIANLCHRTILLEHGSLLNDGPTVEILPLYLSDGECTSSRSLVEVPRRFQKGESWKCMEQVSLLHQSIETSAFPVGGSWTLRVDCVFPAELTMRAFSLGFSINDSLERILIGTSMHQFGSERLVAPGRLAIEGTIESLNLTPGRYSVSLFLGDGRSDFEIIERAIQFEIVWKATAGVVQPPSVGCCFLRVDWK